MSVVGVVMAVTSAITGAVVSDEVVSSEDSSVSPHDIIVRKYRNMMKMMSICLNWFPIRVVG